MSGNGEVCTYTKGFFGLGWLLGPRIPSPGPLLGGGSEAEASIFLTLPTGICEKEDLPFSILYIPLLSQLSWVLRAWRTSQRALA